MSAFEPGAEGIFLDLPAETYHKAPGISQSTLKRLGDAASPAHFKALGPVVPTEDMKLGTVCHCAILEPERLGSEFWERPETYPDSKTGKPKPWHGGADWCKEWLAAHADRIVLTHEHVSRIKPIVDRVTALEPFGAALRAGRTEVSWFKRDEVTGCLLKCRCDLVEEGAHDTIRIWDLKKVQVGGAAHDDFQDSIRKLGYHIQAASYIEITGAEQFVFVPFDDDTPFDAAQWELNEDQLRLGRLEYRRLLNLFAECTATNNWPGYPAGIKSMDLSKWDHRRLEEWAE